MFSASSNFGSCFVWVLGLSLFVPGCGGSGTAVKDSEAEATAERPLRIAVIPKCTGGEFWETVEKGARAGAAANQVEILWEGPLAETEIAEQNKLIENMVTLDVDGIAVAPLNPKAIQKSVQAAVLAGIPVVVFDSSLDGDAHTSYVATNNVRAGGMGAEGLGAMLGGLEGKRIVIFRYIQGTASTEDRSRGFLEAVRAAKGEVLADPYSEDSTIAGCKKVAVNTLEGLIEQNRLQVDGIFAANLTSTLGTVAALEDLRKSGIQVELKFIGFDSSPKLLGDLREGLIDGLIAQNPQRMGFLAVETLVRVVRGAKVEPEIETAAVLVTRENLAADPAIQALVGAEPGS